MKGEANMYYHSTRDESLKLSSCEAIIKGLAPDGGLFVPDEIPCLSKEEQAALVNMKYTERAVGTRVRWVRG